MPEAQKGRAPGLVPELVAFLRGNRPARDCTSEPAGQVRAVLGVPPQGAVDPAVQTQGRWTRDGLEGEELSWDVGYGPPTRGRLLRPRGATGRLPALLLLHCHGGVLGWGKDKLCDGESTHPPRSVRRLREVHYAARPVAEDLARSGFVVLVHDVLGWGSRSVPLDQMPDRIRSRIDDLKELARRQGRTLDGTEGYELAAAEHEPVLAKLCGVLGTSLAGLALREDMIAFGRLQERVEVHPDRIAAVGFSGGGCRAGLLGALDDRVAATVIIAMMACATELVPHYVDAHTWMFHTPGLWATLDWPELVALRAPTPLLVQYGQEDPLFPARGMRQADEALRARYGVIGGYTGRFHAVGHVFNAAMQAEAADWLHSVLDRPRTRER